MKEPIDFKSYLENRSLFSRDAKECGVKDCDIAQLSAAAAEILASPGLLARLGDAAKAITEPGDAWNAAPWKGFLPDGPLPDGLPASLRFGLAFPVLANLGQMRKAYAQRKIPLAVLKETMLDLPRWIDTFEERSYGKMRGFAEISWLREHLSLRIFQIGRLQFQPGIMEKGVVLLKNGASGKLRIIRDGDPPPGAGWETVAEGGEPVLNVHIPCGSKLRPEAVDESFALAAPFFRKYFPEYPAAKAFQCSTWLLYEGLEELLPPSSNIIAFKRRFANGIPHEGDGLFYERVFSPYGRAVKRENLKTSLQKALFGHIESGRKVSCELGLAPIPPQGRKLRIGVLGSGSGSNMQSILEAICAGNLDAKIEIVISDKPDAKILERAEKAGIKALYIDHAPFKTKLDGEAQLAVIRALKDAGVDTVVLAGYMRIVKKALLDAFPMRVLNIHPALLPSFPGIAGWTQALDYGAKLAGCTVHFVDEGVDSGPIIVQKAVPVEDADTPESLHARIQTKEHEAFPEALKLLSEGRILLSGRHASIL